MIVNRTYRTDSDTERQDISGEHGQASLVDAIHQQFVEQAVSIPRQQVTDVNAHRLSRTVTDATRN